MKTIQIIALVLTLSHCAMAQTIEYQETMDDPYVPMPADQISYSSPYLKKTPNVTIIQVNTTADGLNIINDAANEPSLAINPRNPNEMVIGWRQFDNIVSNFRKAGFAYSDDGGETWINLPPIEGDRFRSDPVLATDSDGKFYYNSLTDDYSCDVFSTNTLGEWPDKVPAYGGDKQWMVIDRTGLVSDGNIYANWKEQFSDCIGNFTRSLDGGNSFLPCELADSNPTRGTMSVGPEGQLYLCGGHSNSFRVLRSDNAKDENSELEWKSNTFVDLKGSQALYDGPNPGGMLGQVWIDTDHSESDTRGNVYLLCSVERSNSSDPSDIMFSKSEDQGVTWSEAITINKDFSNSNWQWFGTLSVAPNGRIDVTWYDTRDNPGTYLSVLYYAFSMDGGETWSPDQPLSEAFDPHLGWPNQNKIGDYIHMVSTDDYAYLAWNGTFNGEQDVYFSKIDPTAFISNVADQKIVEKPTVHPNPFSKQLWLTANSEEITSVQVYDLRGNLLKTLKNETSNFHSDVEVFGLDEISIAPGMYLIKVTYRDHHPMIIKAVKN